VKIKHIHHKKPKIMSSRANPLIYLLDDDLVYLKLVKAELIKNNWTNLQTFNSYQDFVKALDKKPDIVILDYHLDKKKTGLDMLLKVNEKYKDVYAIFLTSEDHLSIAIETMKNGAYDYVVKSSSALVRIKHLLLKIAKENKMKVNQKQMVFYKIFVVLLSAIVAFLLFLYYSAQYGSTV